ncbi:MAG: HlyD family efflux transporter periplasmic adaptor subunit [Prolixibacteraceae bacterium]|jgi:HlyD family secretion protein|nr:HlyD family efflux transporter periplasmic adaptor subunit [Prolixibacteraceae bacterium]
MRTNKLQILIVLFLGLAIFSCNSQKDGSDAFGNFEADDQLISSEIAGKLLSCNFEEGMTISKGAEIAVVDTLPIQLQISQLKSQQLTILARKQSVKSQLAVVEQQKKNLEVDRARVDNMLKDGAATRKQKDDITGNLELLDKQKESTRSQETVLTGESEVLDTQLAQLQDKLNRCRIVSPINGLVLERYKKIGELVGQGQSLCRIADVSSLNLRVFVSGDQLPHLKIGQTVKVLIDATATKNRMLEGTVSWISSEAEFTPKIIQTKAERVKLVYAVKIKVANDGALKIGMPGEIKFLD